MKTVFAKLLIAGGAIGVVCSTAQSCLTDEVKKTRTVERKYEYIKPPPDLTPVGKAVADEGSSAAAPSACGAGKRCRNAGTKIKSVAKRIVRR